ncbi:PAS domain-containing sensor histidine kinase [Tychonema bourrellyi FEM_GT703]|uniref:histidine kinase n=2 Tax=Tychonema bourrellyi TaxID=54313 RepID=A0A2G4EZG5_9CYAN|nr:PAS domain-containing sensor histidine kinase [Tychonema bourrellyi FEM_GT703]
MQTMPVKQKSQVLERDADGRTFVTHQLTEATVSESKEQFRRLVEHSPDTVAMVDCEMRYLSVSSRWQTACGLSGGDAIGRSHWELFPNLPEYWHQSVRAILAGVLESSEFVVRSTLGTQQTEFSSPEGIKWAFEPWKNGDGAIGGLIVTSSMAGKISSANCDRQLPPEPQTHQLETAAQITKIALHTCADLVFLTTSEGQICYANEATCRNLGYSQSELQQLKISDINPQLSLLDWQTHSSQVKEQNSLTFEAIYQTKEGRSLPVEVTANYFECDGEEYRCAIARDLSDRKVAESALLEAKEQLQAVLDAVPGLVSWVSSDLRYLGVNCHLAAAYQMPADIFLGQKVGFLETSSKFNDLVYKFFANPEKTISEEVTASVKGENKTYLIVAQKYQKDSKAVFVGLDITDREQALLALQESEERLRQQAAKQEQMLWVLQRTQTQLIQTEKMSSLGQLVAGVAHEINNPVSFISGNVSHARGYIQELLRVVELYQKNYPNAVPEIQDCIEELDLDFVKKDLVKLLNSMQLGSERIRDVVRSLRLFSRTDESEMKSVDIHEGLDSALLILQNRLQAKGGRTGISLVKEYGNLPRVHCYPGQLNQVFMHLLTNAIDALETGVKDSKKSGIIETNPHLSLRGLSGSMSNPEIRIRTTMISPSEVAIAISDNGPGMTEEVLGCIFDPLFTTKPPGTSTGLGLSISRHLVVEKHGGKLEYISEPGRGTEVVVKIAIGKG